MKKFLFTVFCGIACIPTLAADSWSLGGISETTAMIVDISTIEQNREIKGTWVAIVHPELVDGARIKVVVQLDNATSLNYLTS